MDLSNLKPASGATKKRKRIARGTGSGKGGHSSTRGNKGQTSRSGHRKMPAWFEGGQMPLQRRVPKFGFKNPFRTEYRAVNLSQIARLLEEGRLDAEQPVTPQALHEAGLVRKKVLVKVLGGGEVSQALTVHAHAFSQSARSKIEEAGGTTEVVDQK